MYRDRKATDEEIISSLKVDLINRNKIVNNFANILNTINKNTILAIDGDWGSGKTYFVKQLEYLSAHPNKAFAGVDSDTIKQLSSKYSVCYYNAWENDDLIPLESVLLTMDDILWGKKNKIANKMRSLSDGIIKTAIRALMQGNFDPGDFTDSHIEQYVSNSRRIRQIHESIDNLFKENYKETNKKVLLIVDDLDRCCPEFTIKLLETLKHNFTNKNVVVVICSNINQLQYPIKKYYGELFDAIGYLDRFYDAIFELPEPNINQYLAKYLSWRQKNSYYYDSAIQIAKMMNMSLRQIDRYFSLLKIVEKIVLPSNELIISGDESRLTVRYIFVPLVIALKHYDIEGYKTFMSGGGQPIIRKLYAKNNPVAFICSEEEETLKAYEQLMSGLGKLRSERDILTTVTSLIGSLIEIDQ